MPAIVNTLLIWRIAIFRLMVHCLGVIGVGYLGAMGNQTWSSLDGDSRFKLMIGLAVTVLGVISAFLDKTVSNLVDGNVLPPDIDGSVLLSKVTETQKTHAVAATLTTPAIPEITETTTTTTTAPKPTDTPVKTV